MKSDAAEQAGVAKNESAFRLMQDKVIVLVWSKSGRLDAQLAGHPQVNPDPISGGKFEKHLFSPRFGAQEAGTGEATDERGWIRAAKNSLRRVELDAHDFLTESGIPLPAIEFDFGQLGHRADYAA